MYTVIILNWLLWLFTIFILSKVTRSLTERMTTTENRILRQEMSVNNTIVSLTLDIRSIRQDLNLVNIKLGELDAFMDENIGDNK